MCTKRTEAVNNNGLSKKAIDEQEAASATLSKLAIALEERPHLAPKVIEMLSEKGAQEFRAAATTLLSRTPSTIPDPSNTALFYVALNQAVPFVGFGIMDNAM
jgi:hypothetical protein